jgi:hypothetical protein
MLKKMWNGKGWLGKLARLYQTDGRRHARLRAEFTGALSGPFGTVHVTGIDLNRDGAGVQSSQEVPEGTLVFLRIADVGLMGFAHVRHCSPRPGEAYFVGLQFRESLTRERVDDPGVWDHRRYPRSATPVWDEAAL